MTEGVTSSIFDDTSGAHSISDCFLQGALVYVMAADYARGARIGREAVGGEYARSVPTPPTAVGVRIFAFKSEGQVNVAMAFFQISQVELFHARQMRLERFAQLIGHSLRLVVTRSFIPLPSRTTIWRRSNSRSLTRSRTHSIKRKPLPAGAEQFCHELVIAGHLPEDGLGFIFAENDGEAFGLLGANDVERLVKV